MTGLVIDTPYPATAPAAQIEALLQDAIAALIEHTLPDPSERRVPGAVEPEKLLMRLADCGLAEMSFAMGTVRIELTMAGISGWGGAAEGALRDWLTRYRRTMAGIPAEATP